ncbi:MAG TPA: hypothetical protein VF369_07645 [candidate division Zixibacteria bacterium]
MSKPYILFFIAVLFIGVYSFTGCHKKPIIDGWPKMTAKGVTLTPRSFQSVDVTDFFQKAGEAGGVVSWAGDWIELGDTVAGAPKFLAEMAKDYAIIPIFEAQFFTQSTGELIRPLDDTTKANYKRMAAAFAGKYHPGSFAFGIEVNVLYEKSPADFDNFAAFYAQVYDTVKSVSPSTKVFTIFQLEKMKGLNGGLFGGINDTTKSQWHLLNQFPKSDLLAFTTYPGMIYKNPSDIPAEYYEDIEPYIDRPISFTEIGWHSAASPTEWESSEEEQAEFVSRFFNLSYDFDKEIVIWSFLYDQDTAVPFNSMGLRRSDGSARPAWDKWVRAISYSDRKNPHI